jgi:hypothetical protein
LFSWRFVAAVVALAVLALLARALFLRDDALDAIDEVVAPAPAERRIDLIEPILAADRSPAFTVTPRGTTTGFLDLTLSGERVVRVAPGTLGELDCDELDEPNGCALFADVLGEAVIWFAILPQADDATVELPPVVDLDDGLATLENGWMMPFPPVIERDCPGEDIPTFADFLRRFGPDSVSIVDLASDQVVAVRCADET